MQKFAVTTHIQLTIKIEENKKLLLFPIYPHSTFDKIFRANSWISGITKKIITQKVAKLFNSFIDH